MTYREIEDLRQIQRVGKRLDKTLRTYCVHSEVRRIGYPGGHENTKVFFLNEGNDSLWYVNWPEAQKNKAVTLFGHGTFGADEWLSIDVQFNQPIDEFHRRFGGAFLEDDATGEIFLAHRGILTLKNRVAKNLVLEAMAADVVEAENSRRTDEYILAASLDSDTLVEDIDKFARRLRAAVRQLGRGDDVGIETGEPLDTEEEPQSPPAPGKKYVGVEGLRDYFEEFSGERRAFTPKKVVSVAYHGKVVHALHEEMERRGRTFKSRAIDLVVDLGKRSILFEVKTGADTQSVYCAIGQLSAHAPTVEKILGKPVKKVIVVPERPIISLGDTIEQSLGMCIVTYAILPSGQVSFSGAENL